MFNLILNKCQNDSLLKNEEKFMPIVFKINLFIEYLHDNKLLNKIIIINKYINEWKSDELDIPGYLIHSSGSELHSKLKETIELLKIDHYVIKEKSNTNKSLYNDCSYLNTLVVGYIEENDYFTSIHDGEYVLLMDLCFVRPNKVINDAVYEDSLIMFPNFINYHISLPDYIKNGNNSFFEINEQEFKYKLMLLQSIVSSSESLKEDMKNKVFGEKYEDFDHYIYCLRQNRTSYSLFYKSIPPLNNPFYYQKLPSENPDSSSILPFYGANHVRIFVLFNYLTDDVRYFIDYESIQQEKHDTFERGIIIPYLVHQFNTLDSWLEGVLFEVDASDPKCFDKSSNEIIHFHRERINLKPCDCFPKKMNWYVISILCNFYQKNKLNQLCIPLSQFLKLKEEANESKEEDDELYNLDYLFTRESLMFLKSKLEIKTLRDLKSFIMSPFLIEEGNKEKRYYQMYLIHLFKFCNHKRIDMLMEKKGKIDYLKFNIL